MLQNSILARIWRLAKVLPAALLVVATMTGSSVAANLVVEGQSVDYAPSPEGAPVALFHVEQKGYRNGYKLDCARRQFLWTSNVELASGQATANTAGAQWRPVTGDSKIARAVFMAICGDLGVTGTLDEVFPTNDFAATLDGTKCTDRCKVAVNGWAVELARVAIDDQGTPAYTLTDAGGQCGMGGCKALFLKRSGYWDHVFEVGGTLFDVLPTRTNGLADLHVRTLGSSGWTNVKYAWDGKRYSEAKPSPEPPPVTEVAVVEAATRVGAGPIAAPMRAKNIEGNGTTVAGRATGVPGAPETDRPHADVIEVKDGSVLTGTHCCPVKTRTRTIG
jgi:hypothetical protein